MNNQITRRTILKIVPKEQSPLVRAHFHANELMLALREYSGGGDWQYNIDADHGIAMVIELKAVEPVLDYLKKDLAHSKAT